MFVSFRVKLLKSCWYMWPVHDGGQVYVLRSFWQSYALYQYDIDAMHKILNKHAVTRHIHKFDNMMCMHALDSCTCACMHCC
jgi:hypothetical protein